MPPRVRRHLSVDQPMIITKLNDDDCINRAAPIPKTLRHSWYKAVGHLFSDEAQVKLRLHEIRLRELRLSLT